MGTITGLAQRFQESRVRAGLTKTALARPRYTVSYVSQIEAGRRSPSPDALAFFSDRLGVSSQYLSTGVPEGVENRLAYQLEEARRAMQDGDPETAEAIGRAALAEAEAFGLAPLQAQALATKGEALHRQGRVREAIDAYEEALELGLSGREAGIAVAALGRAYRAVGDLSEAVDVVQRYLARSGNGPLDAASVAELQTVLVSVYFERGDMVQAERAAGRALAAAEGEIPTEIKAKAFWDASRVLAEHKRWNEALDFATRARILLEDLDDRRRVARLHNAYAYICLEFDPPRTDEAARHLDRAEEILVEVGGPADLAYVYTERARMALLQAEPDRALESADRALLYGEADLMEENRAMFLKGRALGELGRSGDARDVLLEAAYRFEKGGARQQAAACWREVGEIELADGDVQGAVESFRSGLEAIDPRRSRA
jgi:tetratricopeptide (TPR) repeat protein